MQLFIGRALFSQFQTIEKMVFFQVWLIPCSNFMYENNDVIVTNARHMFKVISYGHLLVPFGIYTL